MHIQAQLETDAPTGLVSEWKVGSLVHHSAVHITHDVTKSHPPTLLPRPTPLDHLRLPFRDPRASRPLIT
ncbi:hypothetical protein E2C01_069356 [Portunus trituberculatus]|uniref:Uncharacterized protein n=1 Tax=Portunus trituberculatus TaxID=210409 RepID=A0A5B7HYB7_PORTR|nr:hypothetical protein [Portunus trituberculatus]